MYGHTVSPSAWGSRQIPLCFGRIVYTRETNPKEVGKYLKKGSCKLIDMFDQIPFVCWNAEKELLYTDENVLKSVTTSYKIQKHSVDTYNVEQIAF